LYGEGIGLAAIQQLLGHRWLSTTVRYVHEPSGIASDGRVCAGYLMMGIPQ